MMSSKFKILAVTAAILLAVSVFSLSAPPWVCLTSAGSAFILSAYLRYRDAFRDDNAPLAGAFLIGGSSMMVLTGIFLVNPIAFLILMGVILIPILVFLVVFGLRERFRSFFRWVEQGTRDDENPPP